ncbi:MAG: TatD family hydrolase [Bdellovibrionales bacterium]|nr:TatD family hydrolase [Bdellovibrionales bacterium]
MMWVDSHCHLNYDYSPKSAEDLVREALDEGVSHLMTIGTDLKSLADVVAISEKFSNVHHTVGVHPHDASLMTDDDLIQLRHAASHSKCRAIGEIGLDTYYEHSPLDIQLTRLKQQLELALECQLPVVIHSRDAESHLLNELRDYSKRLSPQQVPGVIHCFTGTQAFGQACLNLGFYISFSGILTFKNAHDLRESAKVFPLDRILVETDSPYLAPVPFRGKKCEPRMVKQTGLYLAELRGMDADEVARVTTENAKRVFRI